MTPDIRKEPKVTPIVGVALIVLGIGVIFYHFVEGLNLIDAFYFCVITLTTVGYGDIVPTTDIGKLFTAFYVLFGVGIIASIANYILHRTMVARAHRAARHNSAPQDKKTE